MGTLTTSFSPKFLDPMEDQEILTVEGQNPEGNNPYGRERIGHASGESSPWWEIAGSLTDSAAGLIDSIVPAFDKNNPNTNTSNGNNALVLPDNDKKDKTGLIIGISVGALVLIGLIWFFVRKK